MSIYSDDLESELKWREAELASLKMQAALAPRGTVQEQVLLRALCAMLYAHYEGFCKYAWEKYLEVISKTGARRDECKEAIICLSLKGSFNRLKRDMSESSLWAFCNESFPKLLQEQISFGGITFDTSNLTPALLKEHCEMALLPHDILDTQHLLLRSLIARRNDIAHGKKNIVSSIADYHQYESAAMLVMHELAVAVVEAIEQQQYLK